MNYCGDAGYVHDGFQWKSTQYAVFAFGYYLAVTMTLPLIICGKYYHTPQDRLTYTWVAAGLICIGTY